ncbi:MAG: hypothetical protein M0R73_03735 [Dehalococcoidia bacterium]|nr:hypothetical protein [Dehalococcoidia bacterium]
MGRERRRRSRRTPRNVAPRAVSPAPLGDGRGEGVAPVADGAPLRATRREVAMPTQVRSDRVMARESSEMLVEIRRVLTVSAVCFGMLAVLVVVERFS